MKRNKINIQTVSTMTRTFQILRNLTAMDWHVLEGAATTARLGQIPKLSGRDVWVQALIPEGSSVYLLCSESMDTWGAVASCWGVGEQWPSLPCLKDVLLLCLFWPFWFGRFCRCVAEWCSVPQIQPKPATRAKHAGRPGSCWDVPLQKHCQSDFWQQPGELLSA